MSRLAAGTMALPTTCGMAGAAEIRVLGTQSMMLVWDEIGATFESHSGHKVVMSQHIAASAKRMIDAGYRFDVAILSPAVIDQLIKEGKIVGESRADIMRVGIAVAVRAGQPRPDVASVEAFKAALLQASSIAYLKTGASGLYLSELMSRLGIADRLRAKTRLPEEDVVGPMVARGEAELGITAMSTLLATPGLDVIGPLPADIQNHVVFAGGISADTASPEAARSLLDFLTSRAAAPAIKAKGLQPGK